MYLYISVELLAVLLFMVKVFHKTEVYYRYVVNNVSPIWFYHKTFMCLKQFLQIFVSFKNTLHMINATNRVMLTKN